MRDFLEGQAAWYRENIDLAQRSIEGMETGHFGTFTVDDNGKRDTTQESLANQRLLLANWYRMLAEMEKRLKEVI